MKVEKKRVQWVDIARAIGVLIVLILHSATAAIREDSRFVLNVYTMAMWVGRQLLFFLAGYTFCLTYERHSEQSMMTYIGNSAKKLLVPYLVYGVGVVVIFAICFQFPYISDMIENTNYGRVSFRTVFRGMLVGDVPYAVHLWFLYDLFVFRVITFAVKRLGKCSEYILVAAAILCWWVLTWRDWGDYIAITNLFFFYIWFILGMIVPIDRLLTRRNGIIACGILVMGAFLNWYEEINMISGIWIEGFLINVLMVGSMLLLVLVLAQNITGEIGNRMERLGRRSLDLYLFQQPFFGAAFGTVIYRFFRFPPVIIMLITVCVSFTATLGISCVLDRMGKFSKLFGR